MVRSTRPHIAVAMLLALSLVQSPTAHAGDHQIGDWTWNIDDPELFTAATETASDHVLAQFCSTVSGSCMYVVGFDIYCEVGEEYPVLVNSDAGATQLDFVCGERIEDQNVLVAADFETMDNIVRSANKVGFAIPLQGDDFKAVRFSLRGSNEAIDAMRAVAEQAQTRRPASRPKPAVERF